MELNFLGQGIHELPTKSTYRILVLGASKTGKTSIVRQFLYDQFSPAHTETMDDMYRGEFEVKHTLLYFYFTLHYFTLLFIGCKWFDCEF